MLGGGWAERGRALRRDQLSRLQPPQRAPARNWLRGQDGGAMGQVLALDICPHTTICVRMLLSQCLYVCCQAQHEREAALLPRPRRRDQPGSLPPPRLPLASFCPYLGMRLHELTLKPSPSPQPPVTSARHFKFAPHSLPGGLHRSAMRLFHFFF